MGGRFPDARPGRRPHRGERAAAPRWRVPSAARPLTRTARAALSVMLDRIADTSGGRGLHGHLLAIRYDAGGI